MSQSRARAGRPGEAADDELLPLQALGFDPRPGAAGLIRAVGPLGDDAFHRGAASKLDDLAALALDMLAVANRAFIVWIIAKQDAREKLLAL